MNEWTEQSKKNQQQHLWHYFFFLTMPTKKKTKKHRNHTKKRTKITTHILISSLLFSIKSCRNKKKKDPFILYVTKLSNGVGIIYALFLFYDFFVLILLLHGRFPHPSIAYIKKTPITSTNTREEHIFIAQYGIISHAPEYYLKNQGFLYFCPFAPMTSKGSQFFGNICHSRTQQSQHPYAWNVK